MSEWLGINIGGTEVKYALISDEYQLLQEGHILTDFSDANDLVNTIRDLQDTQFPHISGIGISVPGTVFPNDNDGTVYGGGALHYLDHFALGSAVATACNIQVKVTNDGKSGALGEYSNGALKGSHIGVVMVLGTGVGGGIIIDGHILYGAHSFGGEFSFMTNRDDAGMKASNMLGFTGGWKGLKKEILIETHQEDDAAMNGKTLFQQIASGNQEAVHGFEKYCYRIATKITDLQAVLDPDIFAISGGISEQKILTDEINHQIDNVLSEQSFPQFPHPHVVQATNRNHANVIGAVYALRKKHE